jgi:hypothetical protein
MKAKTARKKLMRMDAGKMLYNKGMVYTRRKMKPYMQALKKDLKNPASKRVHDRMRKILFS